MLLAAIIGIGAAVLLLTAGYLFGVNRGYQARDQLRKQNLEYVSELVNVHHQLNQHRSGTDETLRTTIQELLTPILERDQLAHGLSQLRAASGRRDVAALLDQIAERGNFSAVLLSNEDGIPLASSHNTRDIDRLAATASLLLFLADRMVRDHSPAPLSFMVHDEANALTLSRIFHVGDQRLSLTAVSTGAQLSPTALDPTLAKIDGVLLQGSPSMASGSLSG